MYIIGIAGGTGSGKTTVVKRILEALPTNKVALIPQDSYYNDTTHLSMEERQRINFDHPDAFDWRLLTKQIQDLRSGRSIEQPTYSYLVSNRLWKKELRALMDLKIYVDADPDERLIRGIQRDTVERGRTTQMVIDRYLEVLKPMHEEFIEPTKRYADLIIPQGGNNLRAIEIMRTYIIHRLKPEIVG